MAIMKKLNNLGETSSGNQQENNQIVNVLYGHYGSGKLYSYYGKNKRTGDIVTPMVTHPKSGKVYKTLGVVQSTHQSGNIKKPTEDYLQSKDIPIKTLGPTNQKDLPGYYQGWEKDAKTAYDLKHEVLGSNMPRMTKLDHLGQITKMRNQARHRGD